ncbi:MAG TPA: sigma-70 family RNA polymerase sigma factor, partial [Thermopolyspora sp.]
RETVLAEAPDVAAADDTHRADLRLVLRHALTRLTSRQRAMVVLRYFEDLPEAAVAQIMGCTVGTVRSTTNRSLAKLRAVAPELADLRAGHHSFEETEGAPA